MRESGLSLLFADKIWALPAPKLSIITINRNNADGLDKTLKGIFDQTFRDFESIVIDGASTDDSLKVVKKYRKKIKYFVSEPDTGIYNAQNKGAKQARGEYLFFLNSGDYLYEKNTLTEIFSRKPVAEIVYGDVMIDYGDHEVLGKMPEKLHYNLFVEHELWHQVLFRRDIFQNYGYYKEDYRLAADYEFYLRTILKHGVSTQYMPVTFAIFNTFGLGSRPENQRLRMKERERAKKENLNFLQLWWQFRIRYFLLHRLLKPLVKILIGKNYDNLKKKLIRS